MTTPVQTSSSWALLSLTAFLVVKNARMLSDTWVLRCMMFIFSVKEANLGMMAFVAYFAPRVSEWYTMSFRMDHTQCSA